ncbi:hypothetical protein DESA109040_04785 [Deinococcus saxicola]
MSQSAKTPRQIKLNDPALKVQGFGKRLKSPSLFEDERLRVLI